MKVSQRIRALRARRRLRIYRLRADPSDVQALERAIDAAHEQAHGALRGERREPLQFPEFSWAKTHLGEAEVPLDEAGATAVVHPDGSIWGVEKFEQLDPEWFGALFEFLKWHLLPKPAFGRDPQIIRMPERTDVALIGDWGTGFWRKAATAASRVATAVEASGVDFTIHLGDTYYAGTRCQVRRNLAKVWPRGSVASLVVPGNHEMYCNAVHLVKALRKWFPAQHGTTFFALENEHWLVLALDTAYHATRFYLDGSLGNDGPQHEFVRARLREKGKRKVIVLTHHQPVDAVGEKTTTLHDEVLALFADVRLSSPDVWYWGHLHTPAIYESNALPYLARCVGHGAIPYGEAELLKNSPMVSWYESRSANDAEIPERVMNGCLVATLDGPDIREVLVAEDGSRHEIHP